MKKDTSARALVFRIMMLLYVFSVAYLCFKNFHSLPDVPRKMFGFDTDKVVHFCMFLPFPILGFFSLDHKKWSPALTVGRIMELCAYGIIFAGITELVQSVLPYRTRDLLDFEADVLAICLSSCIVLAIELIFRRKSQK